MACSRYIELNPVRAGLFDHPGSYRWSSYCEKTVENLKIVDPDPFYIGLSDDADHMKREIRGLGVIGKTLRGVGINPLCQSTRAVNRWG